MDELEKQLRERRAELDGIENYDRQGIWLATSERLDGNSARRRRRLRRIVAGAAAAIVLLIVAATALRTETSEPEVRQLADISTELARQEAALRRVVREREIRVGIDRIDTRRYGDYLDELSMLDSLKTYYEADLPEYGTNERLIASLLRLYEMKIELLCQLEREIELQNNPQHQEHDPSHEI